MFNRHKSHGRMTYGNIKIYAGTASQELTKKVAEYLEIEICDKDVITFPNDNLFIKLHNSVRGQDCYVIQTTSAPVHNNLMELLITIQTLRLDSAARIIAVIPYLCYGRSDKKDQPRVPITARLVTDLIEVAGADRYITMDLHADQIQGFFNMPGDVLSAFHLLTKYLISKRQEMQDLVVTTADLGFAKKGRNFAAKLDAPMAFIEKRRAANDSKAEALTLIGDVKDRDVVLIDDEIDTGSSMIQAINILKKNCARNIYVAFVHPVFSANAAEKLALLPVHEFITTDTIPIKPEEKVLFGKRLTVLSIAPLIGEVIKRVNEGRSVGELFNE